MVGITSDELRRIVWDALVRAKGDRAKAAVILGKSVRSLNRYIHDLNLFADMDRAGLIKHAGPPRNVERGTSRRQEYIVGFIKRHGGQIDYSKLAAEMYGEDNDKTRQRIYSALTELKAKGIVATDGFRWIVL